MLDNIFECNLQINFSFNNIQLVPYQNLQIGSSNRVSEVEIDIRYWCSLWKMISTINCLQKQEHIVPKQKQFINVTFLVCSSLWK